VNGGRANVLGESLKASVVRYPLALSVIGPECKIHSSVIDKDAEVVAELK